MNSARRNLEHITRAERELAAFSPNLQATRHDRVLLVELVGVIREVSAGRVVVPGDRIALRFELLPHAGFGYFTPSLVPVMDFQHVRFRKSVRNYFKATVRYCATSTVSVIVARTSIEP